MWPQLPVEKELEKVHGKKICYEPRLHASMQLIAKTNWDDLVAVVRWHSSMFFKIRYYYYN